MAYTTIDNPFKHFNTVLYTGNGTAIGSGGNAITGVGFQPDWVWIKNRSGTTAHHLQDVVRGSTKAVYSNLTNAEGTSAENVNSFDSDGFTVGSGTGVNTNANNFASWNWLAANGTASNSDGSITSTISANTTAGFSIVKYTGTGSNLTAGHGLGSVVKMFFVKELDNANSWEVFHASEGASKNAQLNTTAAFESQGSNRWNSTAPTSTTISIGTDSGVNRSSSNYIAYCFAEIKGYSKFGSYTGNGSTDGPFIYTGFKPAFVIVKNTVTAPTDWIMIDNKRPGYNLGLPIQPNLSNAEGSSNTADLLSNGFKVRNQYGGWNGTVKTLSMAFAEAPFVTAGTKAAGTAR